MARFAAWLDLPDNKKRRRDYLVNETGKTGLWKDRLKDLVIYRLHEALGFNEMLKFAAEHRKRNTLKRPLKYYGEREPQCSKDRELESDLCSDEAVARKAMGRTRDYLAQLGPPMKPEAGEFIKHFANVVP